MKHIFSMLALVGIWGHLSAQVKDFTYQNDRMILNTSEFYGASFVPSEGKLSTSHNAVSIELGMAQFKLTSTGAIIKESVQFTPSGRTKVEEETTKMSIPRINDQSYGYEIVLMDINNADIQGYIKVYIDPKTRFVTQLIYRPNGAESERTYLLPKQHPDNEKRDSRFFTHNQDLPAAAMDDFWSADVKTIFPHAELKAMYDYSEFNRIYPKDRVSITFEQRLEKIANSKKEKLVNYICLKKPNEAGEMASEDYQVKKLTPVKGPDGNVQRVELDARDANQNKFSIVAMLTPGQTLNSIVWGTSTYVMRNGKRAGE